MTGLHPLRPLQEKAMAMLRESLHRGNRRPTIQAPTGFGKTVLAAHIVAGALAKRKRVAFVVPMLNLIDQTFEMFRENGLDTGDMGVIQGDHPWRRPQASIQICSAQTLAKRGFPEVDFVVVDENHLRFECIDDWQAADPSKIFVGLSATPWSRGMAKHWDDLLIPTSISELIALGDLSKFRVYAPSHPDLSGIKTIAGDYHEGQLSERMSQPKIVADVCETWLAKAENRPTLLFAVDRAHAAKIHQSFEGMGVSSAYVDALTPRDERQALRKAFARREVQVICSIGTMTTGVDMDIRCISFCRPTKSQILFVQSIGRGLRPAEGKEELLILDHSDTHLRLGMVTDIHHSRLRGGAKDEASAPKEKLAPMPKECPKCLCLIPVRAPECPGCGFVPERRSNVLVEDGELVEMGAGAKKPKRSQADELEWYAQLLGFARQKQYKPGWAIMKCKEKFRIERLPSGYKFTVAKECGNEVRSWLRSRQIFWAKSKANPRNQAGRDEARQA